MSFHLQSEKKKKSSEWNLDDYFIRYWKKKKHATFDIISFVTGEEKYINIYFFPEWNFEYHFICCRKKNNFPEWNTEKHFICYRIRNNKSAVKLRISFHLLSENRKKYVILYSQFTYNSTRSNLPGMQTNQNMIARSNKMIWPLDLHS